MWSGEDDKNNNNRNSTESVNVEDIYTTRCKIGSISVRLRETCGKRERVRENRHEKE